MLWPVSRFVREFLPMHWDGCVVLTSIVVNWGGGLLSILALFLFANPAPLAWVHVVLFGAMPVVGFVWFVRDSVSWRERWQVLVSIVFQVFWALLPWFVLVQSLMKRAG